MIGYKTLDVYQRSYKMAKEIHQTTQNFPSIERHELGSQLRRAAVSIVLKHRRRVRQKRQHRRVSALFKKCLGFL